MALKELSEKLYPAFKESFASAKSCRLFLSASTLNERAIVRHAIRGTPEQAWSAVVAMLEKAFVDKEQPSILRADWVTSATSMRWSEYVDKLKTKMRGYFRRGIAFDKDYKLAFMEQELNANSILYSSKEEKTKCEFQPRNADAYCRQRFRRNFPRINRKDKIEVFNTSAIFIQDGMDEPLKLISNGDFAERRPLNQDEPELFISMAKAAAKYLAAQCMDDGRFTYGFYPCNDDEIKDYSLHRHLGALFALAQAYAVSDDGDDKEGLGKAIERGLSYAINNVVYHKTPDGEDIAYLNDGKRSTVGMSGLALLTLTKWTTATGTRKYLPLMNSIARGLFTLQKADGSFIRALNIKDLSVSKEIVGPFYDSVAIYGMLRLYAITKAPELLESCERILNHFIETEYWKNCDHWLAYAVNEFTLYRPEEKYFELGLNNTLPHMPKMLNAFANSPIRLEQILATNQIIGRMKSSLLERLNMKNFYSTMKFLAEQVLDAYFFPEVAMYFQKPARILNSFFVRNDSFRVRIDDVQHSISGVLAYAAYLKGEDIEINSFSFDEPIEETSTVADDLQPVEETSTVADDLKPVEETSTVADDLKPVEETSTVADDLKPVEENSTVADDLQPVEETSTVADDLKPVEETSTVADDLQPAEETSTVADNLKPAEENSTVADDLQPAEEPSTVADDLKPVEEPSTVADNLQPAEETSTVADNLKPAEETSTVADDLQPAEEPSTVADNLKPAEETSTVADNFQPVEEPSTVADDLQPVEEPSTVADDLQPVEELSTVADDLQPVEEPSTVADDLQPVEEPSTVTNFKPPIVEELNLEQTPRRVIQVGSVRITIESEPNASQQFFTQDNPPLQVGLMKKSNCNFWELSNQHYPLFCMAKHFNIEILFFAPEDIDFKNKTVKALTLENNSKVRKLVPLPRIIDNDITYLRGESADIMEQLKKYSYLIRPVNGLERQLFYDMLSSDGHFKKFLVQTQVVSEFSQLLSLLDKYHDDVILKPATNTDGKGMARIKFDNGKCIATFNNETTILKSIDSLLKFYEYNFSKKDYSAQPYCISQTRQGNPFTIRLHTQRGAKGKVKVFASPQIGSPKDLVPKSSYTMNFEDFLKAQFGEDWQTLYDNLMDLGYTFPDHYQSFLSDTIFDIGLDICIQQSDEAYDLKIVEAYLQPDFANIRNEVAVTNFEYYKYLDEKLRAGSLK